MSWVRIWVHLVFATKYRLPVLDKNARELLFAHIRENASSKDIWLDCINGSTDHAHCLVSLKREQSISKVAQLIKGESSCWANKIQLISSKFIWQDDYWAISIGESQLKNTRIYILNQEIHHLKKSFLVELNELSKKHIP